MNSLTDYHKIRSFLKKSWIVETIFFFLVLWQESVRLSLRIANKDHSVNSLRDFYFYNFGDFVNGYVMAFIIDGLANYLLFQKTRPDSKSYKIFKVTVTRTTTAIIAAIVSIAVIMFFEIGQSSAFTTADLNDIPAGAGGAIFYCVIRLIMIEITKENIIT